MNPVQNNIKVLREHLKLSQEAFGKKFKCTRAQISSYEGGMAQKLPAALVEKLCTFFSITNEQLTKQKLTAEDLKVTGRIESVTEIKLESALRENQLLRNLLSDKEKIIRLLEKGA